VLELRPALESDVDTLVAMLNEPENTFYWGAYEAAAVREELPNSFVIVIDGAVHGWLQTHEETDPDYPSVAFDIALSTTHHNQRHGRETLRLAIAHFAARGHHRFTIDPRAENDRAIRCYRAVGYADVGIMRAYERDREGNWRDALFMDLVVLRRERTIGCLLGGAVGDALGEPVEFNSEAEIRARYGADGITELETGHISDDTQMTLFTAEGLLRGDVGAAYRRWLFTQGEGESASGGLVDLPALHARRAPGNTCLGALRSGKPVAHSKGCGGVMRAAPAGLMGAEDAFAVGVETAAITHGHPSGTLAAGFLALAVERLTQGAKLEEALDAATTRLVAEPGHEEVLEAVTKARAGERRGEGWVAEEALAIAVHAVTTTTTFRDAIVRAVNHGGDSDSTGAIAGNLAGALYGPYGIPQTWLDKLELRDTITQIAEDLARRSPDSAPAPSR
jgi:ADP-ribosylglycohydrolase/RimJ/RimL family protein N-acetyltransferase